MRLDGPIIQGLRKNLNYNNAILNDHHSILSDFS